MAYKRNLRLMQRALPPSLALSLSLSLSAARVVSSLQPRLDRFSRPYATSGLTFRPATSQPDSQLASQPPPSTHSGVLVRETR